MYRRNEIARPCFNEQPPHEGPPTRSSIYAGFMPSKRRRRVDADSATYAIVTSSHTRCRVRPRIPAAGMAAAVGPASTMGSASRTKVAMKESAGSAGPSPGWAVGEKAPLSYEPKRRVGGSIVDAGRQHRVHEVERRRAAP